MESAELLLISGLLLAALAVYLFTSAVFQTNNEHEALSWAAGNEPRKTDSGFIEFSRTLVHNFTLQHAVRIKSERYRKNIEKKLLTAGLSDALNVNEFIGLQILWGLMFPAVLIVMNFTLEFGYPLFIFPLMAVFGAWFPHNYVNQKKKLRYVSVTTDLPFFIDLLALSTEAGLDFIGSIQRIVDKAEDSVLAEEFAKVLRDIKLGSSREEALRNMSDRLDIAEISGLVSVLVDAMAMGASIAKVLKDQSNQMRLERFVRAEKAGARASQAILIPLMIFILPAVFIVVFAPIALSFYYGGG